jgi:hypothetical protein
MRTTELSRVSRAAEGRSIRRAAAASYLATINKGNSEKVVMVAWPRDEGALYPLFLGAYRRPHLRTHPAIEPTGPSAASRRGAPRSSCRRAKIFHRNVSWGAS